MFAKKLVGCKQLHAVRQLNGLFLWHRLVVHRLINLQFLLRQHNANMLLHTTHTTLGLLLLLLLLLVGLLQLPIP